MTPDPDKADALAARRLQASQASGGISADPIYRMALAALRDHGPREAGVDFGAGQGGFAGLLAQAGLYRTVTAADLMPRPAALPAAIGWIQADLNDRLPLPDASCDVIAALEVIEHLENPRAMLRDCFRLLRPGGLLLVTTPNNESLRSQVNLLCRGHFAAFGPDSYPAHITPLLRIDLLRASQEAGFVDQHFAWSNHGTIPGLPRYRWQSLAGAAARGRLFSDNLMMVGRRGG